MKISFRTRRVLPLGFALGALTLNACGDEATPPPPPSLDVELDVYARPGLLTVRDSTLVIALNRLAVDFDAALPGQLALVDVAVPTTPGSPSGDTRFAVVRSDYQTTAIATLNRDGAVTNPAILDSGSQPPGLTATLSGDVVMADTLGGDSGVMTLIDRFGTDVITNLTLASATVEGQINVAPENSDFSTNPQDVEIVSSTSAWVSRFGFNLDPAASGLELGNDVIEFDPQTLELTGRRVDLSRFDNVAPSDPGDADTLDPVAFALPSTTRNCGEVRPVPETPDLVLVGCRGFAQPFGEVVQVRATSGVFVVRINGTDATVIEQFLPSQDTTAALTVVNALPLDATTFVAVEAGADGAGDRVYAVDLESGEQTLLVESPEAFSLGIMAFDPTTGLLLIPDSSAPMSGRLHRLTREDDGSFVADEAVTFDGPLPPRQAYLLP